MKSKLLKIFSYIESDLIERTVPVRLSLLAALSGEHLLLLGPPGTAKSELARKLCHAFSDIHYFERLLTRFSVPEELFGPLSLKALEEDRYHRLTKSYLPDANIAFIDEIFKANSAILNSLLTLLNEREFDNGSVRVKTPLISVIAASNELPEEGLEALFDRFMIRYQLAPVSDAGFDALLKLNDKSNKNSAYLDKLTMADIESIQLKSASIKLDSAAYDIFLKLRLYLAEKSIYISDRRWRKALKILQVCAYTNDRHAINKWDCLLLTHLMWQRPQQYTDLTGWFINELNLDISAAVNRFEKLILVWEQQLQDDANKHIQKVNVRGEKLYITPEGETTTHHERVSLAERDNEVLFLAPADQKDRTNNGVGYTLAELEKNFFDDSYKQTHIDGHWIDVQNYINNTQNRLVNRIVFEPLVETFYFSHEYALNQRTELSDIINNVDRLSREYSQLQLQLKDVACNNIWLSCGLVDSAYKNIESLSPMLVDFQQRLQVILNVNESLKVCNKTQISSN